MGVFRSEFFFVCLFGGFFGQGLSQTKKCHVHKMTNQQS